MGDKMVNNVGYTVINNNNNGLYKVKAIVGGNGIEVIFDCLEIEYENDFTAVQSRLRVMIKESLNAI